MPKNIFWKYQKFSTFGPDHLVCQPSKLVLNLANKPSVAFYRIINNVSRKEASDEAEYLR